LALSIYGNPFQVVPKHIWEKENPTTFTNFPPVTISAYKYKSSDPNGSWFLWEKRDDWKSTDVGQIVGEPKAKYVLFRSYGTESAESISIPVNRLTTRLKPVGLSPWRSIYRKPVYQSFPAAGLPARSASHQGLNGYLSQADGVVA
jgi:hypothetical protein